MKNYNKYKLITQKVGFTLVELLVSIGIIAVVTSAFLISYNQYKKSANLNMATQEIVSNIRRVQNYALASKEDASGSIPDGGWGIYFDVANNDELIVFADTNSNGVYNLGEEYESIILPKEIIVKKNKYPNIGGIFNKTCEKTSLVYKPPTPKITIKGKDCAVPAGTNANPDLSYVEIQNTKGEIKTIKFNNFGLIDVE